MLKLIIAEDDMETRNGLCECIQWPAFNIELVKAVSNGKEAFDYLKAVGGQLDILITDVKMPLMDGVQLVSNMRNSGYKTKVIIITAFWEKEYVKAAFEYDAADYILKPINLEELDKVLAKVCKECNAERALQEKYVQLEQNLMQDIHQPVTQAILEDRTNSYISSINKIIDIITTRYMKEITIQTLADQMFMTPNYLSLLFKKNTGQTINEYITKVRMEKAMELLRNPSIRVFEVSQLVGYKNSDYFTKIFKRYTGIKPFEYKEMSIK